jgi:thymidine phosphorylase
MLDAKTGQKVDKGRPLARLYTTTPKLFAQAEKELLGAYSFGPEKPEAIPLILDTIL